MHAYASAYGCSEVQLIYPWHSGLTASKETRLRLAMSGGKEPILTIVCVDLDRNWLSAKRGAVEALGGLGLLRIA